MPVESIIDTVGIFPVGDYDWIIQRPKWKVAGSDPEEQWPDINDHRGRGEWESWPNM